MVMVVGTHVLLVCRRYVQLWFHSWCCPISFWTLYKEYRVGLSLVDWFLWNYVVFLAIVGCMWLFRRKLEKQSSCISVTRPRNCWTYIADLLWNFKVKWYAYPLIEHHDRPLEFYLVSLCTFPL